MNKSVSLRLHEIGKSARLPAPAVQFLIDTKTPVSEAEAMIKRAAVTKGWDLAFASVILQ